MGQQKIRATVYCHVVRSTTILQKRGVESTRSGGYHTLYRPHLWAAIEYRARVIQRCGVLRNVRRTFTQAQSHGGASLRHGKNRRCEEMAEKIEIDQAELTLVGAKKTYRFKVIRRRKAAFRKCRKRALTAWPFLSHCRLVFSNYITLTSSIQS